MNDFVDLVKRRIRYDPVTGKTYWKSQGNSGKRRPDLIGKEAGGPYFTGSPGDGVRWRLFLNHRKHGRSRIAFICMMGRIPKYIDHINGIPGDDRWCNLREVTNAENGWNRGTIKNRTSKLPTGVRRQPGGSYSARITTDRIEKHLGCFKTSGLAHKAYLEAKKHLHKGFGLQFFDKS